MQESVRGMIRVCGPAEGTRAERGEKCLRVVDLGLREYAAKKVRKG
jgi:hypothetical protein